MARKVIGKTNVNKMKGPKLMNNMVRGMGKKLKIGIMKGINIKKGGR